jgi:putative nucleotidyltransferase with HDIG domain
MVRTSVPKLDSVESYLHLIHRAEGNRKCTIMDDLTLGAETAKILADHIEANRRKVVTAVLQSKTASRPGSIAASLFVNSLLDRFALECETRERGGLDAWINEFGTVDPVLDYGNLILVTFASLSVSLAATSGSSPEIVRHLAVRGNKLEGIVSQTRLNRLHERLPDPTQVVAKGDVTASLLAALEAHDPIASEHCRAVGEWCRRIAEAMNVNPEGVQFIALCGTLHDIGKMGTPSDILLKAGPLTNAEWDAMRAHSEQGAKIVDRVASLKQVAPIIRAHHERYDGFGYPDRLIGNEIPLAARIVAVADAFNAMISHRPYRKAMSVTQAVGTLMDGRGTQWDPMIVDVMVTAVKPQQAVAQDKRFASEAR